MAHLFVIGEHRELWSKLFESDLSKRRYTFKMMNGKLGYIQPNIREIKLYDISVPKNCIPKVLQDLAPFTKDASHLKGKALLMANILRASTGLKSIYDMPYEYTGLKPKPWFERLLLWLGLKEDKDKWEFEPTNIIRKRWSNIMPIGWAEDVYDPKTVEPNMPEGGELV